MSNSNMFACVITINGWKLLRGQSLCFFIVQSTSNVNVLLPHFYFFFIKNFNVQITKCWISFKYVVDFVFILLIKWLKVVPRHRLKNLPNLVFNDLWTPHISVVQNNKKRIMVLYFFIYSVVFNHTFFFFIYSILYLFNSLFSQSCWPYMHLLYRVVICMECEKRSYRHTTTQWVIYK